MGYPTVRWRVEKDGRYLYVHRGYVLHIEVRGQGIGAALLAWAEDLISELAGNLRAFDGEVVAASASATGRDSTGCHEDSGYR